MVLFSKFDCSSWRIWHLVLLMFLVLPISEKSLLNEGLEYGRLSDVTVVEFLEPSSRVVLMYA